MVQKAYTVLSRRIAEEMQLLAEEKWIIDALTQVRKERNCLQIERLEIESIKTQLERSKRPLPSPSPTPMAQTGPSPPGSAVNLMITSQTGNTLTELEKALPEDLVDDTFCNDQQLNLTVTDSIFKNDNNNMEVEEEESDGSDEEDSPESIFMDMNMFMNSDNLR